MGARAKRWGRRLLFPAAVLVGLAGFLGTASPVALSPGALALNYVENAPTLSSAGIPTRGQFGAIARAGFGVVLSLVPKDALAVHDDEQALVEGQGMRFYNVPVDFAAPTREDYERVARILRGHAGQRVLVHCELGLRAASFVFLYRTIELGEDPDRAWEDVVKVWVPATHWRRFMREVLESRGKGLPMELAA